jgi:transcriptional regulator GlxA family with amidase domain
MSAHDLGSPQRPLRIAFVLARDFTMSAFAMFVDTLRLASDEGDRSGKIHCDWEVISATGHLIRSSTGVEIAPTASLCDPRRFSHVAVVGGLLRHSEPIDRQMLEFIRSAAGAQIPLIGLCTGSFVLAGLGLLRGRKACVSWYHLQEFKDRFPETTPIADRLFLVDGNRITCSGGAGSADLAAFMVERYLGSKVTQKALQVLQIERARAPSDPQPRKPLGTEISDDRVRRALLIMEQSLSEPLRISEIARRCGLTSRGLERLFLSNVGQQPNAAYVRMRLQASRDLVETTKISMTDIAASTGFTHCSNFSRRFKEAFGISPTALRRAPAVVEEAVPSVN